MTERAPLSPAPRQIETVFLFNLLQDVNILRGLVYLAARETDTALRFMVSHSFIKRDVQGIWQRQLTQIAADVSAEINVFSNPMESFAILQGRGGTILAASESSLSGHHETHNTFRVAPPGFLKVTLQHGFECVGFLQNREHVRAHGRNVTFGADVVCGWLDPGALTAMASSQRSKLYVTGPSTLLQVPRRNADHPAVDGHGMVCENMHSVRLTATGNHRAAFMDIFFDFCADMEARGKGVTLRPHPGGQYVLKNNVALPGNVRLNNLPIYNVDLPAYAYGISAPSSVVIDMVLAGIPVGVWRDPDGIMDAGNYDGLTEIAGLDDWRAFERDAELRPEMLLTRQRAFLERSTMITDPAEVYRRFARLLVAGERLGNGVVCAPAAAPAPAAASAGKPRRILFLANGVIPTLQLSFLKPLAPLVMAGQIVHHTLTGDDLIEHFATERGSRNAGDWLEQEIEAFRPDLIVACRYSSPHSDRIVEMARRSGIPLIFHVDDDLLNIPPEIGQKKYEVHSNPKRLHSVNTLLNGADLVYCSTRMLKRRLRNLGVRTPITVGRVYCTSRILRLAEPGPVRRIGYMGFDHAHDFEIALPALEQYLENHPEVEFELFGSIPMPEQLLRFGDRITLVEPVRDYAAFLQKLAARKWDIGICPLAHTAFNTVQANTKWVEYTAAGMATIATRGMVYDDCASQGRGVLIDHDGWLGALEYLTRHPDARYRMAQQAQTHLLLDYCEDILRQQLLAVFEQAEAMVNSRRTGHSRRPLADLAVAMRPDADGLLTPQPQALPPVSVKGAAT